MVLLLPGAVSVLGTALFLLGGDFLLTAVPAVSASIAGIVAGAVAALWFHAYRLAGLAIARWPAYALEQSGCAVATGQTYGELVKTFEEQFTWRGPVPHLPGGLPNWAR